jgi:hypothetical protein
VDFSKWDTKFIVWNKLWMRIDRRPASNCLCRHKSVLIRYFVFAMAKKSAEKASILLLPLTPFENLVFDMLCQSTRCVSRILRDLGPDSLLKQGWALSTLLHFNLAVSIADTELCAVFHHTGSWTTSMIAGHKSSLFNPTCTDQEDPLWSSQASNRN